jgi:hypothetical protein
VREGREAKSRRCKQRTGLLMLKNEACSLGGMHRTLETSPPRYRPCGSGPRGSIRFLHEAPKMSKLNRVCKQTPLESDFTGAPLSRIPPAMRYSFCVKDEA